MLSKILEKEYLLWALVHFRSFWSLCWVFIVAIDQFDFLESLYQPIVSGAVIGAILGDLPTGLIVGGTYQLMTIGNMPVGGAQPQTPLSAASWLPCSQFLLIWIPPLLSVWQFPLL